MLQVLVPDHAVHEQVQGLVRVSATAHSRELVGRLDVLCNWNPFVRGGEHGVEEQTDDAALHHHREYRGFARQEIMLTLRRFVSLATSTTPR